MQALRPFANRPVRFIVGSSVPPLGRLRERLRPRAATFTLAVFLFAPVATFGLELGDASIRSGLGQALRVEIPYRLAANERLTAACITLVPASRAADSLPTYTRGSRIDIGPSTIEISNNELVREPLIGLNVDVNCNTAPRFVRSYQLFVDPPSQRPAFVANRADLAPAPQQTVAPVATASTPAPSEVVTGAAAARSSPVRIASAPAPRLERTNASPRARGHAGGDVTQGQTYRVVRGDTLSGIAARVADRPVTIRETVDAIFAANAEAFVHGNRDLIEEGRTITIPILSQPPALTSGTTTAPVLRQADVPAAEPAPAREPVAAPQPLTQPARVEDVAPVSAPVAVQPLAAVATSVTEPSAVPAAKPSVAPAAGPSAAPVAKPTAAPVAARDDTAASVAAPSRSTGGTAALIAALLAVGAVVSLAWVAFVRRRRKTEVTPQAAGRRQESRPRPRVERGSGIEVIEERSADAPVREEPTLPAARVATPHDFQSGSPALDLPLVIPLTDSVDLDVGTPHTVNERIAWFEDRVDAVPADDAPVGDETIEENAATARLPDVGSIAAAAPQLAPEAAASSERTISDEQMTLTIVELDMLRQDYEAEHTLTQASSQELHDAVADLEATKAARAAARATAKTQPPRAEPAADGADAATARIRVK